MHEPSNMSRVYAAADCAAETIMGHLPRSLDVLDYFSLTPPTAGPGALQRYRLKGCDHPHFNWQVVKRVAMIWDSPDLQKWGHCLWSNMLPSQIAFIVILARVFKVTHLVECGRMGGMPLTHYAHFGLNVTSFELNPIPWVKDALAALVPAVRQIDGDCVKGIPAYIEEVTRADPTARIAIVLDGPKGYGVISVANTLAEKAVFIAIDDQSPAMLRLKDNHNVQPRWPYVYEGSAQWNAWVPTENMYAALATGEAMTPTTPSGRQKAGARVKGFRGGADLLPYQYQRKGSYVQQMVMLGGRWRWV